MKNTLFLPTTFLLLFAACTSDTREAPQSITYWSANNQYEIDLAKVVVAEWNQQHPDFPVQHQPIPEGQSSEEVILAAVVGKNAPDVYSNMWPGDVQLYARARVLMPLNQFADFDSVMQARNSAETLREARSLDGNTYQIAWKTNPIMMIYNSKMLRQNGFDHPPATYSEFIEQAKVITADLDGDGYTDRYMSLLDIRVTWWQRFFDFYTFYIAASGGKMLMQDGKIIFDNPSAVAVFRFLRFLFEKGYCPLEKAQGRVDAFLSERVATRFTGPWEIKHAEKFKPEGFEYDFAPVPVPDDFAGPRYTYGDIKSIVMFKTRQKSQKVWQFVKFLISQKNDYRLLELTTQLPVRKNILQDSLFQNYFVKNPALAVFAKQAEFIRGTDLSAGLKEIFDAISQEYEASVVYGAKSAEEAVKDAAQRARLILK